MPELHKLVPAYPSCSGLLLYLSFAGAPRGWALFAPPRNPPFDFARGEFCFMLQRLGISKSRVIHSADFILGEDNVVTPRRGGDRAVIFLLALQKVAFGPGETPLGDTELGFCLRSVCLRYRAGLQPRIHYLEDLVGGPNLFFQVFQVFLRELCVGQHSIDACRDLAIIGVDHLLGHLLGLPLAFLGLPRVFFRQGVGFHRLPGVGFFLGLAHLEPGGILLGLAGILFGLRRIGVRLDGTLPFLDGEVGRCGRAGQQGDDQRGA